jgi:hypothetical protein
MLLATLLAAFLSPAPAPEPPNSHLWVINEIFSSPDGTIQFIEMLECCGSTIETQMNGKSVTSQTTGNSFTFPQNLTGNTAHRHLLLATAGFAALSGAPAPDFILPDNFFSINGDTLRWFIYANATLTFTVGQLPLDGQLSLNRNGTTGVNSPTNYAGQSGSVSIVGVPAMPTRWLAALVGGAVVLGWMLLRRSTRMSPSEA